LILVVGTRDWVEHTTNKIHEYNHDETHREREGGISKQGAR
jgi:hypothetical protein